MSDDRLVRILGLLAENGEKHGRAAEPGPARLCEVAVAALGVSGAGVMLMSGDVPRGYACSSDDVATLIEDLQYTLGEGPCVDAYDGDRPVSEPDLAEPAVSRWPAFSPPAIEAGVGAVFGFPLHAGGARLGALNLYNARPGALDDEQHADALVMADVAARGVLTMHAGAPSDDLARTLGDGADFRLVVHQAAGVVAVQLDCGLPEALVRLRAHAFAQSQPLDSVAEDVVSGLLRLPEAGHTGDGS